MNVKLILTTASVGLLVLGVAVTTGAPADAAQAGDHPQVLRYTATYTDGTQQDAAPAGDSIGDTSVDLFHLTSTEARSGPGTDAGRDAGSASSQCTLLRAGSAPLAQCTGALTLTNGTVVLGGTTTDTAITTYAVLGGTGRFVAAQGTAAFAPSAQGVTVTVTLTH